MAKNRKVIITCAVTGAIHTPSMSPHLPVTAQEIADAAVGAAEAGAAIIHLHARDPATGKPDQRPEAFVPFLKDIKAKDLGMSVVITQSLGGTFTVATPGGLARIELKDADALGVDPLDLLKARPKKRHALIDQLRGRHGPA